MPVKKSWSARVTRVGSMVHHLYSGYVATGMRYEAYLLVTVQEGPEKGREVVLKMTSEEAVALGQKLIDNGLRVQDYNERI